MRSLHLFAGIGGGIIGDLLAGNEIVGAVEIEPFCQDVLRARQADGSLPAFPIYGDIRDVKGDEFGPVELVCGGFPCQDISLAANAERKGLKGEKSGLFYELVRIVDACDPVGVFLENVPAIVRNGLADVLATFAERGFDAEWTTLSARDCGAPHTRNRWWGLFYKSDRLSDAETQQRAQQGLYAVATAETIDRPARLRGPVSERGNGTEDVASSRYSAGNARVFETRPAYWAFEPYCSRVVNGTPARLDGARIKALGNAQVPICAYLAYETLLDRALESCNDR